MRLLRFDQRRMIAFVKLLLMFLVPPALFQIPGGGPWVLVKLALLVPTAAALTIPAVFFSVVGVPLFDFSEFGALPKDGIAWTLIAVFWVSVAFFLSLVGGVGEPRTGERGVGDSPTGPSTGSPGEPRERGHARACESEEGEA